MLAADNMVSLVLELQKYNGKQQILCVFLTIIRSFCFLQSIILGFLLS